ncbi:MAG: hypothetical protein J0L73_21745 [Verrucomicrobia bacterium]|nr:hypothetical protein [Verrucomicrobiota bacterium]
MKQRHSNNTLVVIQAAFPHSLADDVLEVMKVIPATDSEPHGDAAFKVYIDSGELKIPYRVYFPEVYSWQHKDLTNTQKAILAAIFTRHHSGYQREIWADKLTLHPSEWSTPFIAALFGDYVEEILAVLESKLGDNWGSLIQELAVRNPKWRRPLNHQILNYWAIYYRQKTPFLTDYPGYKLAERFGLWDKKTAPRLIKNGKQRAML